MKNLIPSIIWRSNAFLLTTLLCLSGLSSAYSANFSWNGTTTTVWSTPAAWVGGVAPTASDTLVNPTNFGSMAISYSTNMTVSEINLTNLTSNWSINNTEPATHKLTVTGNLTKAGAGTFFLFSNAATSLLDVQIGGTVNLNGGGMTIGAFGASQSINSFTANGLTTIQGGSLLYTRGNTASINFNGGINFGSGSNTLNTAGMGGVASGTLGFTTAFLTNSGTASLGNYGSIDSTVVINGASGTSTFSGTLLDGSTGKLAILKSGASTQVLSGTNTYTGGTTVNAGTLALGNATNTLTDSGAVTVDGATAILSIGGNTDTVGAVSLKNGGSITGTGGTLTGASFAVEDGSVSAKLGGAGIALTKSTSGTVTLSGANTYTGSTTITSGTLIISSAASVGNGAVAVNGGTLTVNGAVGSGGVTVANGATLGGNGTISGAVSIASGGTFAPGNSPGIISTGNLTLAAGSSLSAEITGSGTVAGTNYDQVNVTGTVTLGGNLTLTLTSYTPTNGNLFFLINNDPGDDITTGFANVNGGSLSNNTEFNLAGNRWFISYAANYNGGVGSTFTGGNDVALYAIPEPATWILMAVGLTVSVTLRRRRRME